MLWGVADQHGEGRTGRRDGDPGTPPVDGGPPRHPADDPADAEALAGHARALAEAVDAALEGWVRRCVAERLAGARLPAVAGLADRVDAAAHRCRDEVGGAVRELLERDVDEQRTTPLSLLRAAVAYPTEVLAAAGVPPVARDAFAVEAFPDDPYDLTPASFADVDPSLHEPGLVWGAAKAHVHRRRHRPPR